jgi:OmcA/MtrC family decaheme c-type cytochrome
MRLSVSRAIVTRVALALVTFVGAIALSSDNYRELLSPRDKAYYADPATVTFVRPGFNITIVSAQISVAGVITVDFKITDSKGAGLDRLGVMTPGTISLGFLAGYIPSGGNQYLTYATRSRTSTDGKTSVIQSTSDSGGTYAQVADGEYVYTYGTKAPTGWDPKATHRIAIYGSRNLTEFDMDTYYNDTWLDLVPGGGTPAPRDIIRTSTCNKCHDQLAFHGGTRRDVQVCVICHSANLPDPNGPTADFKVMIHKIHAGSSLPSVIAGGKYTISTSDWSTVVDPSDVRRCQSCHESTTGAAQADVWKTRPTRAACGSCHDDVNFATGANHVNLPQVTDNQCAGCHVPGDGKTEYDASVVGSHFLPQEDPNRPGLIATLIKVDNGVAGKAPTITYSLKDSSGAPVLATSLTVSPEKVAFVLTGPTSEYGATSFGSDVTTPGYVSETAGALSKCAADGVCTYTFAHAIPAAAKGTFAIGIEARRAYTILPGTARQTATRYGVDNKVIYFSVDGSTVAPRRTVVDTAKCNKCHTRLALHGENRNNAEYCVFCHNPNNSTTGTTGVSIDFPVMVHNIHYGENMVAGGYTYAIGSSNFSDVRYPAFTPRGAPGDTANCSMCHVNGSEAVFPVGKLDVKTPSGYMNPTPATTAACTACHKDLAATAHAATQTDVKFGESCTVCHGANGDFSVGKVHAGK